MRPSCALSLSSACLLAIALSGCSLSTTAAPAPNAGLAITGSIHGGQQPIAGAHVYLFAANTSGYGGMGIAASTANASVSLLNVANTGLSDSVGAYVATDSNGNFSITGDYSCTPNTEVYVYALGGNPGAGMNSAAGLLAALGTCPSTGNFATATPFVFADEVSTIAAAYAFAGFATDATHVSSSGTALAQTGIANAFANATNLAGISTGAALATTPSGTGTVPQTTVNTLANILAACVNSTGPTSTACSTLFADAKSSGSTGTTATDTATAAINIAHNPAANVSALFNVVLPTPPFAPALGAAPNDFTLAIQFSGSNISGPSCIAIDSAGNAWIESEVTDNITKMSNLGVFGTTTFNGSSYQADGIAIDNTSSQNVWIADQPATTGNGAITKISSSTGAILSGGGFTGGGISLPLSVAIDGSGNVWTADYFDVSKLTNAGVGAPNSPYSGGGVHYPAGVAIDGSGNAWVSNVTSISELSNSGVALSGVNGYTNSALIAANTKNFPNIVMDGSGNAWLPAGAGVVELNNSGTTISPQGGYTGGGMSTPGGIVIDGANNAWIANYVFDGSGALTNVSVVELSSSGTVLSGTNGFGYTSGSQFPGGYPNPIAVDGSGDVWLGVNGTNNSVTEFIGAAVPVITPIAAGLPSTPTVDGTSNLGTRP